MKIQRKYGWRPDSAAKRAATGKFYRATAWLGIAYSANFDLGPNIAFSPLDQGQLGACTAFALKRCAWYGLYARAVSGDKIPEPSALFQYFNERNLDGDADQDAGSTISQGINALKQFGICPESDWPYNPAFFSQTPPAAAYQDATNFEALAVENIPVDAQQIQDCLFNQRLPIAFGSDLFAQFESEQCAQDGIVTMPPAGATPIGGHAQCIRGWKTAPDGSLLLQINNSWGGAWGDNGCAWFPWAYVQAYFSDLWAIVTMK